MTDDLDTIAPNEKDEVARTMQEHPEIDTMDEEDRAEIIDITARRLNPGGGEKPWGRKARQNNPTNPNLNTDAMTFLRPDGNFEIYDVISGVDGSATWDNHGVVAPGDNGYWWPPNPVEDSPVPPPVNDYQAQIDALHDRVETLETNYALLEERLDTLEAKIAQPLHCHGPINLPVVADGFSLRTVGDIDVAVTPGEATPPPPPGEPPSLVDIGLLKRLFNRLRPEETP